jgi:hypothetical protein
VTLCRTRKFNELATVFPFDEHSSPEDMCVMSRHETSDTCFLFANGKKSFTFPSQLSLNYFEFQDQINIPLNWRRQAEKKNNKFSL